MLTLTPPSSHKHEFSGVTGGFTMLIMKAKYVCHNLISPCVSFYKNRTMRTNFYWSFFASGGEEKRAQT